VSSGRHTKGTLLLLQLRTVVFYFEHGSLSVS
jgi:hypothetical protein